MPLLSLDPNEQLRRARRDAKIKGRMLDAVCDAAPEFDAPTRNALINAMFAAIRAYEQTVIADAIEQAERSE